MPLDIRRLQRVVAQQHARLEQVLSQPSPPVAPLPALRLGTVVFLMAAGVGAFMAAGAVLMKLYLD